MAYWKDVFQETKKLIPSYGTVPNKATFDPEYHEKRHKCYYDPNHPYKPVDSDGNVLDFEQFMWLVAEVIKTHFMSRSSKEPSLMVAEDFNFFIETKGAFKGYRAVNLSAAHAGKKNESLTVSNHTQKDKEGNIMYIPTYQINPNNPLDEYNIVNLLINVVLPPKHLCKDQSSRIFRYIAAKPQLIVSRIMIVSMFTYIYLICDVYFCLNGYG